MKKKLLALLLLMVMCTVIVGCNSSSTKKEEYNIAYVLFYTDFNDRLLTVNPGYSETLSERVSYSSWTESNNSEYLSTVFIINDWDYGDNDTIILYLRDGRILQTASSNVVLMYEPSISSDALNTDVSVNNDNNNSIVDDTYTGVNVDSSNKSSSNESSSDGSAGLIPGNDNETDQTYIYNSEGEHSSTTEFEKTYEIE